MEGSYTAYKHISIYKDLVPRATPLAARGACHCAQKSFVPTVLSLAIAPASPPGQSPPLGSSSQRGHANWWGPRDCPLEIPPGGDTLGMAPGPFAALPDDKTPGVLPLALPKNQKARCCHNQSLQLAMAAQQHVHGSLGPHGTDQAHAAPKHNPCFFLAKRHLSTVILSSGYCYPFICFLSIVESRSFRHSYRRYLYRSASSLFLSRSFRHSYRRYLYRSASSLFLSRSFRHSCRRYLYRSASS